MQGLEVILVIGSGGREHALAIKLAESPNIRQVFVAPGNAGTSKVHKVENIVLDIKNFERVSTWCQEKSVSLVVIGPEDPLAAGIVDFLVEKGITCFGPTAAAAQIESSKDFSKKFMVRHDIPTAKFESFTDADKACKFINESDFDALVVKASGLAAGKGVVVASSREEACEAARDMLTDKRFGSAGEVVVVEELLEGPEVSVLAFSDGHSACLMPPAQDHKRLKDKDEGPNTGGMGAVCPYPGISEDDLQKIKTNVIERTIKGLAEEGIRYVGVLYAGLMLTKAGPKVLEFNCRFGDPETQSIMQLLTSDLLLTLKACANGKLSEAPPKFDSTHTAVGVVLVSGGYPGSYKKGLPISGLSEVEDSDCCVIHSGTTTNTEGQLVTNGGRVLSVVAIDTSLNQAREKATNMASKIEFEGAFHRKDIGMKILRSQKKPANDKSQTLDDLKGLQYKDAGVDIVAGDDLVRGIKPLAKMTRRPGCDADLGGFGGLFDLEAAGLTSDYVLTCSTCGVGKKIKFAQSLGEHYNIGQELVVSCINELMTVGAEPLFFLDYFAVGHLNVSIATDVVKGMADSCLKAGCALIGGETAEMPGMYQGSDYDVAGFAVGALPKSLSCQSRHSVTAGDVIMCLETSALQYQDYDLLEEVLNEERISLEKLQQKLRHRLGEQVIGDLFAPSQILPDYVLQSVRSGKIVKMSRVTQGVGHTMSGMLSENLTADLDTKAWELPHVFAWLANTSGLSAKDMVQKYSCGLAAVLVVKPQDVTDVTTALVNSKCRVKRIGHIQEKAGDSECSIFKHLLETFEACSKAAFSAGWGYFTFYSDNNFSGESQPRLQLGHSWMPDVKTSLCAASRCGSKVRDGQLPTFDFSHLNIKNPVMVSGTDGVGTKLKIAQQLRCHSSIGIDLVAMCVNDVLASGAEPLFFTSYLACGRFNPDWTPHVLKGVSEGCQLAGCALLEQKLSTMPSIYQNDVYDLAGFSVAAVDKSQILPLMTAIQDGDVVIGLPSSGLHSNGFSLVRRVVEINGLRYDQPSPFSSGVTLGQDLLTPTRIYVKSVLPSMKSGKIKSFAHITGGGLVENIPRVMPPGLGVCLDAKKWNIPPVYGWLQHLGKISSYEMSKTFNCGIGAVLVVNQCHVEDVMRSLSDGGESPAVIGSVVALSGSDKKAVEIQNLQSQFISCWSRPKRAEKKKRVAVLISGSGTNLQALIDHTLERGTNSAAEISLVISNKPGVMGLVRAERACIPTLVISHKDYKSRVEFDEAVHEILVKHNIEMVCLAGFMRILTGGFVNKWSGRMLNVHPSLLPSFKGANAHKMVLEARVRISGCSVHFVAEEVDAGAILVQESVPVYANDTEHTLSERVKTLEHSAYPAALEMVASGQVELSEDGKLIWNW